MQKIYLLALIALTFPAKADWQEIYKDNGKNEIQAAYINSALIVQEHSELEEKTVRKTEVKILFRLKNPKNLNEMNYVQGTFQTHCGPLQYRWLDYTEYNKNGQILDRAENSKRIDIGKVEIIGDSIINMPKYQDIVSVPFESAPIGSLFRLITETVCNLKPTINKK